MDTGTRNPALPRFTTLKKLPTTLKHFKNWSKFVEFSIHFPFFSRLLWSMIKFDTRLLVVFESATLLPDRKNYPRQSTKLEKIMNMSRRHLARIFKAGRRNWRNERFRNRFNKGVDRNWVIDLILYKRILEILELFYFRSMLEIRDYYCFFDQFSKVFS